MSALTTLESASTEKAMKACTKEKEDCVVPGVTIPNLGLDTRPLTVPPTGTGEGKGVVTNQEAASWGDVAGRGSLDTHPFWILLRQACYTDW